MDKERLLRLIVMYADFRSSESPRYQTLGSMVFGEICLELGMSNVEEWRVQSEVNQQILANLGEANYG